MSVTAVRSKTKAETVWPKIFPEQVCQTYCSSVVFMKQLTLVAVSTIAYIKNALPEDCFSTDVLAGTKLKVLKYQSSNDLGCFLYTALTRAFEAFEKQYLQQLVLCFYSSECLPENLVEFHVFEYQYSEDGVTMSVTSQSRDSHSQSNSDGASFRCDMRDVQERTVMLIRSCMVMMELNRLPDIFDVSVRLYYNDSAPPGYQVPGFQPPGSAQDDPTTAPHFESTKLGFVATPYHSLVLTTFVKNPMADDSREALASQNAPEMTPTQALSKDDVLTGTSLRCVCPNKNNDMDSPLLVCQECKSSQHAICYGVRPERAGQPSLQLRHRCVTCGSHDRVLAQQPPGKRACLAVFRCTLAWCWSLQSVSIKDLGSRLNLTEHSATKLIKALANTGIVPAMPANQDRLTTRLKIDHKRLSQVSDEYFTTYEEDDLVTRLVEETLAASQEMQMQPDPVGEVLGPMKQVSLQNTSNIGRVIDKCDANNNTQADPTLILYKEALVKIDRNIELDLILSGNSNPMQDASAGKKRKAEEDTNVKMGVAVKKVKTAQHKKKNK